jgi:hypothetical protein
MTTSTWLDCAFLGCGSGTTADPRHLANLTASGGWYCPEHDRIEVPC